MVPQPIPPAIPERKIYTVRVLESEAATPTAHRIRATRPADFAFRASSAVRLTLQTALGDLTHPMSIASSPSRNYLEWIVRNSGSEWKTAFVSLQPGDEFQIEGPRGSFFLEVDQPAVLIAGGIGITPFKSMLEYAADAQLATPITLIYSSQTPDEIVCNDDLAALALKNPRVQIIHTLTRHLPAPNWSGRVGRINLELVREISAKQPDALYYICGAPAMVQHTLALLHALDVTDDRIRLEQFKGYARYQTAPA